MSWDVEPADTRSDETRVIIVSGDDFGLTDGICRGILEAHDHGILRSTSVIANGPAFPAWATALRDSGIDVGVHLTAVGEDPPLLTGREIPSLVGRDGRLPAGWRSLLRGTVSGRIDPDDLRREFDAQLEAVAAAGLSPSHVDSHQHVHLWPSIANVVISVATRHGIPSIRVPEAHGRGFHAGAVRRLTRVLRDRAGVAGLGFPDRFFGLETAGAMGATSLHTTIDAANRVSGSCVEIGCHPGLAADPDRARYRWGYRWGDELSALTDPATIRQIAAHGFRLGSFLDVSA